jgi:DNA-binding SARP family transcriptional activator
MKVLKANEIQYKELNGFENLPYRLSFIKDADDNWIIDENVLYREEYNDILDKLKELEVIDYNPKKDE